MKLGVFLSDLRRTENTIERLKAEKFGIFLVSNGIYHATQKFNGEISPVLKIQGANYYALLEDLQTRGLSENDLVDKKIKVTTYDGLVDLIMNDYEQLAWL